MPLGTRLAATETSVSSMSVRAKSPEDEVFKRLSSEPKDSKDSCGEQLGS